MDLNQISKVEYAPKQFPEISCIYILFDGNDVAYVGRTENLRRRHNAHHRANQFFEKDMTIGWIPVAIDELKAEECKYINELNPYLNCQRVSNESDKTLRIQGIIDPGMAAAIRSYMTLAGVDSPTSAAITLLRNYLYSSEYQKYLDNVASHPRDHEK